MIAARNEAMINAMPFIPADVDVTDELLSNMQADIIEMLDTSVIQMQATLDDDIRNRTL